MVEKDLIIVFFAILGMGFLAGVGLELGRSVGVMLHNRMPNR